MSSGPVVHELPARPTQEDCKNLYELLLSNEGCERFEVVASKVERMSALLLQILISANRRFLETGHQFVLTSTSNDFKDGLTLMGIDADYFEKGEHS